MTVQTQLQQQRKQQQGTTNLSAAQTYDIAPNQGSTVPDVMQTQHLYEMAMAAKNSYPNIKPPSDEEIQKTMWISSGLVGLIGALVTGDAAAGIAIGMSGALAVHDHGYDLRQRAEYIHDLHEQGFSARAIENWYETGDNKELNKEAERMQQAEMAQFKTEEQQREFAATERDKALDRRQRASEFAAGQALQRAQLGEQHRHNTEMENGAKKTMDAQFRADDRNAIRETQKLFEGAKARQGNLDQAHLTIEVLRDAVSRGDKAAAAAAYHEARAELARAFAGGGATLTEQQLKEFSGLPAWIDSKANDMGLAVNGMPTNFAVDVLSNMATIGRESDLKTVLKQGASVYDGFKSQGFDDEAAQRRTAIATQGTGVGNVDWKKEVENLTRPEQSKGSTPPHAPAKAIAYLVAHPDDSTKQQFKDKYGYLPEGI